MSFEKIAKKLDKYHSGQDDFHKVVKTALSDVLETDLEISENQISSFFERLIEPNRSIRFKVEWFDDDNQLRVNRGYRIQFNNTLGPYKGGLRFHPSVDENTFKFLAFEQTFKNALTGIPMGGAKGGSDFDPKGKSESEIFRFCRAFMEELYKHIGSEIDVPAGDIGVGVREIGFLYGHYLKLTDRYSGVLTGKHPNFGGSCGREEATGHGAVYFLNEALKYHKRELKGMNVLISGSGNVALHAAEKLIERGANVLTLSDSDGTLHFPDGLEAKEIESLKHHKFIKRMRLMEFNTDSGEYLEGSKPWGLEADCAFPCATQNEISGDDAKALIKNGSWVFCEGSNMSLDSNATEIVVASDSMLLPSKAANAGGVAVSGLERTQNSNYTSLSSEEVDKRLQEVMNKIHYNCTVYTKKENEFLNYKVGANAYAFQKIYETTKALRL